jgi:hypothetical protein
MSDELRCVKCGSGSVIPEAQIADRTGHGFAWHDMEVTVNRNPDSIFKGSVRSPLRADVCGACGFVELHVADPEKLWAAHEEGRFRKQVDASDRRINPADY